MRIGVSVAGGALVVLALVGLAYTCWALMTPMFAFGPVPVGSTSIAALLAGGGLIAVRRRLSPVSSPSDVPER